MKKENISERVEKLLSQMTLEEKVRMLAGKDDNHIWGVERLGIPDIRTSDGPIGPHGGTAFPSECVLASTWDTELAEEFGKALAQECRALGIHIILGPGTNMHRAPIAGRNNEYLGEDPRLASEMVVPIIEGIQGEGVLACVKHYCMNNIEMMRTETSSTADERTMRELYLPAFEAAVKKAKVGSIMGAYNAVNGTYCCRNTFLMKDILKGEWGFDGILMSDWGTGQGEPELTLMRGLDLAMPCGEMGKIEHVEKALKEGRVTMERVDGAVRRMLTKFAEMGFLDREQKIESLTVRNSESFDVSKKLSAEGTVLLKNNNVLPLDRKKIKKIAVFGPNAEPAVTGICGSSCVDCNNPVSLLDAIRSAAGGDVEVVHIPDAVESMYENSVFYHKDENGAEQKGLVASYHKESKFENPAELVRVEEHLNTGHAWRKLDWLQGLRPFNTFGVIWEGYIRPEASGVYHFVKRSNAGMTVWLDGKVILDDRKETDEYPWLVKPVRGVTISLEKGRTYEIKVQYLNMTVHHMLNASFGYGMINESEFAEKAKDADAAIICAGYNMVLEGEGLDRPFELPYSQDELIKAVASANSRTVVLLNAGGGVDARAWIDKVPAMLQCWYPGETGNLSVAGILFGDINPSGKLCATFDYDWSENTAYESFKPLMDRSHPHAIYYREGVFMGYRGYDIEGKKPLFAFGHGLSYTTFEYSNITIAPAESNDDAMFNVSFDVKNTGDRDGDEIAQLYIGDKFSSVARPVKELKGFRRISLAKGEKKTVTLPVTRRDLSFYDIKSGSWVCEDGEFTAYAGGASDNLPLCISFNK